MANATMTTFTVEDENGNQVTYDVADAKARADIEEIRLNGTGSTTDLSYVTPQMFGAKADGVTDDTKAINDAIEAVGNNGMVFFPEGTYLVSSSMSSSLGVSERYFAVKVYQKENITLRLSPNARIKHRPFTEDEIKSASTTRHYVVGIMCSSNIKVIGGHIQGESAEHVYHTYQDDGTFSRTHGYGINIYSSDDVVVRDCEISHCYGDGIHISIASGYTKSNNAIIENCDIHDCIRLGIGVCGANNTLIKDCRIHDIVGASPQSGIDFEPDYVSNMNIDSIVDNCVIHDCAYATIVNAKANRGVQIRDCKLYGKVTSTCDDTHPIEYNNCDIVWYQSGSAHRNVLRNCRIAVYGTYEMGDDVYDCIFDPNLFDHMVDGFGSTATQLLEAGPAVLESSMSRFYGCTFIADNNGGYASNFMLWRNNGKIGTALFSDCTFRIGQHSYSGLNINVLKDLYIQRCVFIAPEVAYTRQFIEMSVPNRLVFADNIVDLRPLTGYSTSYNSIVRMSTKDVYVDGNQLLAKSKVCTYAFSQTFADSVGEIYWLRNYMPLWDTLGSLASATASKFISSGNITSATQSDVAFTEADKSKLDNINEIISDSGFITEAEAKGYTDNKVADALAQGSQFTPSFAATVDACTDTSKVYVLPDGDLYGYMMIMDPGGVPQFKNWLPLAIDSDGSIFNGVGYKDGHRLNTAGNVVEADYPPAVATGYIPCKSGDTIRISNITFNAHNNYVLPYKSDFSKYGNPIYRTGYVEEVEGSGIYVIDTSSFPTATTAYVRLSVGSFSEDTVITINEEIVYSEPTAIWRWENTGHSVIKILDGDIPVDVATEADITEIRSLLDNKVSSEQLDEALEGVEVSDTQIASAVADYIAKNPISGSGGADVTEGTFFVEGSGTTDSTAKTSTWTGTSNRITEYYDGLTIRYKIGVEGQSTVTLNINGLGAKTVYRFSTTKLTTQFPVGSIITLIYHEDLNDGCWITNDYDANTNTYQRLYPTTTSAEYPITARYNTTTGSSYYAEYGRYSAGVTLNPSTNTITATNFKGSLIGNADTATKATQDAGGNVIASTYAKVANAETWTFTLEDGSTVTKKVVLG